MARTQGLAALVALLLLATLTLAQNTTLAVKCTTTADCLGPRGSTFCDPIVGVCALRTCGVNGNANAGLACSLFNSSTYCTSLPGGGQCVPRLALDAQCNPALEVGSGMFTLPSIPGLNSNASSVEQTNSQCMPGLKCDETQGNVCKTDGPFGWVRYMWEAKRGTILAIAIGILALLVCCCCWGCWMCGCAAVSTACMACSCLKSCCTCCCPSGKSSGGGGGGHSKQPAYVAEPAPMHVPAAPAQAPVPQPAYHASNNNHGGGSGNVTYHEASYSNSSSSPAPPARPVDSSGYAGKIVNIETEQIVMTPVATKQPSPPPAPAPAPPASYHSVPQPQQHNMYAQPVMQQPQPQYGGPTGYIAQQPSGGSGSGSHMYAGSNVGYTAAPSAPYSQPQQQQQASPYAMPTPMPVGVLPQNSGGGGYYQPDVQVTKEQMMYGQPLQQQQGQQVYPASPTPTTPAYAQQQPVQGQPLAGGYYQQQLGQAQGYQGGYGGQQGNVYGR